MEIHTSSPPASIKLITRSFISLAALFVKVIAKIFQGLTPFSSIKYAMRWVKTRVLPLPAPAMIKSGPSVNCTASACRGFIPFSSSLALMKNFLSPLATSFPQKVPAASSCSLCFRRAKIHRHSR